MTTAVLVGCEKQGGIDARRTQRLVENRRGFEVEGALQPTGSFEPNDCDNRNRDALTSRRKRHTFNHVGIEDDDFGLAKSIADCHGSLALIFRPSLVIVSVRIVRLRSSAWITNAFTPRKF